MLWLKHFQKHFVTFDTFHQFGPSGTSWLVVTMVMYVYVSPCHVIFTESAPLGRFIHRVAMSVWMCVCAIGCSFFQGFSLVLRSHDHFQAAKNEIPFITIFLDRQKKKWTHAKKM